MFERLTKKIKREPWISRIEKEIKYMESDLLVKVIVFWKRCFNWFYGIQKIRLDGVDIKLLRSLIKEMDFDFRRISLLMLAFFNEHKFKKYFIERGIVPTVPKLLKYRNEFLAKIRFIEPYFVIYERYSRIYDYIGMHPLIKIHNNEIPFGLDIPQELKAKGIRWFDILEIRNLKMIAIDGSSKIEFLGYAHFSEEIDKITGEIVRKDNSSIVYLHLSEISEFYLKHWFNKSLAMRERREVFEEWKKKELMS